MLFVKDGLLKEINLRNFLRLFWYLIPEVSNIRIVNSHKISLDKYIKYIKKNKAKLKLFLKSLYH